MNGERFGFAKPVAKPSDDADEPKRVWRKVDFDPDFLRRLLSAAKIRGKSIGEYIEYYMPHLGEDAPVKSIMPSVTDVVIGKHRGKNVETTVKTLLGAEQIFDSWVDVLSKTKKYAQLALYDFQHESIAGGRDVGGADLNPGWQKQQQILKLIEEKAAKGVKFQIIIDNSLMRPVDQFGNPIFPRPRNNAAMIEHLRKLKTEKGLPIEVVAFPSPVAHIYHIKMLIADGKRAIVGGMNLSNHSAANWDACVELNGPEVANLQQSTFYPDWRLSRAYRNPEMKPADVTKELPVIDPVQKPAIQVLNTFAREYDRVGTAGAEEIGAYIKERVASPEVKSLRSEQFIATHKEIKSALIQRAFSPDKKLDIKFLHSSSVIDAFPYSRKSVIEMKLAGVPVRFYNEWEAVGQKLHAKWTVFNDNELLIGSSNMSARGLESNMAVGQREDYPNHPGERYKRGNREVALVIKSPKIARTFIKQFDKDWEFSPVTEPSGYGNFERVDNNPALKQILKEAVEKVLSA